MRHLRTPAVVKLTRGQAIEMLDQALLAAKALDAAIALVRPAAFVAAMKADPNLICWERCADLQHRPVYRGMTLEISDQLYPSRVEKHIGSVTRSMRAVTSFGRNA